MNKIKRKGMVDVYRIDRISIKGNQYGLARDEKWSVAHEQSFETISEAEQYVLKQNRAKHAIDLNLQGLTEAEIKYRCVYDPALIHRRTYFLGRPPIETIKERLAEDGAHIKNVLVHQAFSSSN